MALGSAWKQMSWLYYQYLLVTALYMLEPWERTVFKESKCAPYKTLHAKAFMLLCLVAFITWVFNPRADSMLVSIVGMALYTGYVFMPQHIMAILHYFEIVQ